MRGMRLAAACHGAALLLCLLGGCGPNKGEGRAVDSDTMSAPSTSDQFMLSEAELSTNLTLARRGNISAMNKLADYYLFSVEDDVLRLEGWRWMEQAAIAGDADARRDIIERYILSDSKEDKLKAEMLKKEWRGTY